MYNALLKMAVDTGGEVIVETKFGGDPIRGRVLDFDGQHFTVFHSGVGGGMLWVFRLKDVACCGLVVSLPEALKDWSPGTGSTDLASPPFSYHPEEECF